MIGVYIVTKNMTIEQHNKGRERLELAQPPTIMPIVDLIQQ